MSPSPRRIDVLTAVPTPFHADESLDLGGVREVFTAVAEAGVDGAFIAGTTGEFTALTDDERIDVIAAGVQVFGAEGAYAHVGAATAGQAERLVTRATAVGARKLAAVTPYYFPAPTSALLEYFARLVAAADGAEVYAYLFTARTTTVMTPEILPELARTGLTGIKISGESDESVLRYVKAAPEGFLVLSGNDIAFAELIAAGGVGVISGVSSVFPAPFIELRDALRAGDAAAAAVAKERVVRAVEAVKAGSLTHLKAGLELRGLAAGPVRVAVEGISEADRAALKEALDDLA